MRSCGPSRTALAAAAHRGVHQVLERGRIFNDALALPILGDGAATLVEEARQRVEGRDMRLFIAARTRFAEDALCSAFQRGARQLVILGAGLDTYAYRGSLRGSLRIFEVDHPATQTWKRARLMAAGITVPASLKFAPLDFERQSLAEVLGAAGFDQTVPTYFTWLGVVPYLPLGAVSATLTYVAGLPGGSHLVFDYAEPPESLSPAARALHEQRAARVEALGEPWRTYLSPGELHGKLSSLGFRSLVDARARALVSHYLGKALTRSGEGPGHVLLAATVAGACIRNFAAVPSVG
ncbi:MAG TPA: SAM-dependent methyltransferase [Steroidobacteraceae bacterium]|nr:SAM-dependent methyltransferase [Steroidobacteraceae bacterium]